MGAGPLANTLMCQALLQGMLYLEEFQGVSDGYQITIDKLLIVAKLYGIIFSTLLQTWTGG